MPDTSATDGSRASITLQDKVALVTGASRGIGQAIAIKLASLGADVGLLQRTSASETITAIESTGRRAVAVQLDLTDPTTADPGVKRVVEEFGRLDIVVCNASIMHRAPLLDIDLASWQEVLDLNLTGAFLVSRAGARQFAAQGDGGRIIHIGSQLSFLGGVNVGAYAATKGALVQLTKTQSNEWAPMGIRVNLVAPSWTVTSMTESVLDDPQRMAEIMTRIPAARWGQPADTAEVVAFLASPAADYVSGVALPVDGGYLGR
jgi:2-deoxy-D-gluconate 3-dehydrogenase